jgi:hypothetical protein
MTQKEIKEVNKRMYEKLVEVKYKVKENYKKEEMAKRNEMKKQYTNVRYSLFYIQFRN